MPFPEIRVSDSFIRENWPTISAVMSAMLEAAFAAPGVVDNDVREALDGLVRTYRTRESGLYYESRPSNMIAAGVFQHVQRRVDEYRQAAQSESGFTRVRDADVLGALVFLMRLELQFNNGRKRGRAFLDFLRSQVPPTAGGPAPGQQQGSSLVLP